MEHVRFFSRRRGCQALAPLLMFAFARAEAPATAVFTAGEDGYHTYRIPALLISQKGTLLAFCEGRKNNRRDHGDVDLLLKRSSDGGFTWSKARIVYEEGGTASTTIGNPCPVQDKATGTIHLTFCRNNDTVFVTRSTDDGARWSDPTEITSQVKKAGWGWYATGPGVGIQLTRGPQKGRLVIPCDHREKVNGPWVMMSHVFYSDDQGKTWKLGASVAPHTDECQVAELTDGRLLINMRNYWGRAGKRPDRGARRTMAFSDDGGETWGELGFDETLIEPVCQASFIRASWPASGKGSSWLVFSNPASTTGRHSLTVRMSTDEGKTWPAAKLLHAGPAAYSCLGALKDGTLACLYEAGDKHSYEKIVCARFSSEWVAAGGPAFKIGVCDWTIGKRADPGSLALAKELGLDGVQVDTGGPGPDGQLTLFDPALQDRYLAAVNEKKGAIASLAMGTLNTYPLKSDPRTEAWVATTIDIARKLDVKIILLAFFGNGDLLKDPKGVDVVVEKLRRLAPKAEQAGVTLAIESWLSAPQLADIMNRVGSPAIKVYYDVGNSTKMGYDINAEIKSLGRGAIAEFHAKDYKDVFGKGEIDYPRVRQAMDAIGYRGWFVVESVHTPLGRTKSVQRDGHYLRTVFP